MTNSEKKMEVYKKEEGAGYLVKVTSPVDIIREVADHFSIYNLEYELLGDIFEVHAKRLGSLRDIIFILGMHNIL